ncbi:hypothetical protein H4R19_005531 [Coemansia spiralis]|nr:hypothetical protein H4R19_005531 [Coemansia spiralis]
MDAILPVTDHITCYFVRHGERVDHVDDSWAQTAAAPYDPPLTAEGHEQAGKTGALIHRLEQQAMRRAGASTSQQTSFRVLTSPFLRCAQTAGGLVSGFQQEAQATGDGTAATTTGWTVAVEPGLSEMMSESYFATPPPGSIVAACQSELARGSIQYDDGYMPVLDGLPEYLESFQSMMARFVSTLDYTASALAGPQPQAAAGARQVVVLVTHGAGISALLWATTLRPGTNDVPYCCVTRARLIARRSPGPLPPFGTSRIPAFKWDVDYRAHSDHIRSRL